MVFVLTFIITKEHGFGVSLDGGALAWHERSITERTEKEHSMSISTETYKYTHMHTYILGVVFFYIFV